MILSDDEILLYMRQGSHYVIENTDRTPSRVNRSRLLLPKRVINFIRLDFAVVYSSWPWQS
jgi:hypothetical protein